MVRGMKIKFAKYPTSTRPTASLAFCQCSPCGLTNHPGHCMLESVCIYIFGGNRICRFLSYATCRQTDRHTFWYHPIFEIRRLQNLLLLTLRNRSFFHNFFCSFVYIIVCISYLRKWNSGLSYYKILIIIFRCGTLCMVKNML